MKIYYTAADPYKLPDARRQKYTDIYGQTHNNANDVRETFVGQKFSLREKLL